MVDIFYVVGYWFLGGNPVIVPLNLDSPIHQCSCCGARMWFEESLKKSTKNSVALRGKCDCLLSERCLHFETL